MNILFISTEAVPFAKSGGLGDVIGSLPLELCKQGVDARVMLPLYRDVMEKYGNDLKLLGSIEVPLGWRRSYCGLYRLDYKGMIYYFLDNEQYFSRDRLYGYYDDAERFAFFSKASLEVLGILDFVPDILHTSEWQSALVPVYLKTIYHGRKEYERLRTVFTIHNIEYQGRYGKEISTDLLGLTGPHEKLIEMHDEINFMKGGIVACDRLTTVSPTYAEEIKHPYFSHGLSSVIENNSYKLSGILNGIDKTVYNPYRDKALVYRYSHKSKDGKVNNKEELQRELGLVEDPEIPIIAMVGRLVEHKGIALVTHIFEEMLATPVQFVLVGTGEKNYEAFFLEMAEKHKGQVAAFIGFSGVLASRVYAGSDFFLMPSISEPCGLSQMIALRYGSVPIVRETGGLQDSIKPFNPKTGKGNGITFHSVNAHDMLDAVRRACQIYYDKPTYDKLQENGFRSDFSWKQSAESYRKMYMELLT